MVGRKELRRKSSRSGDKANTHARGFCWGMELDGRVYIRDVCVMCVRVRRNCIYKAL
ncbi:hypothetical protein L208DRAFT_1409446 [Tricholoma matsutake]|nr:hypothetical protein L208DRAFT_1409446 [Tricholoma matsutake 945]